MVQQATLIPQVVRHGTRGVSTDGLVDAVARRRVTTKNRLRRDVSLLATPAS
jgi:hypothetical protein